VNGAAKSKIKAAVTPMAEQALSGRDRRQGCHDGGYSLRYTVSLLDLDRLDRRRTYSTRLELFAGDIPLGAAAVVWFKAGVDISISKPTCQDFPF
jgi:hypothetical protein